MSEETATEPSEATDSTKPDESLPPVEAPSASFIIQLFLIPMIIVSIIVVVWFSLHWLAHMGTNPKDLVQGLKKGDDAAWQKAATLADMLRNPQMQELKQDRDLAAELASVLEERIEDGSTDENQIKLRMWLCHALGEFKVDEGLPALLKAAVTERDAGDIEPEDTRNRTLREVDVRRAAIESLAILISNVGTDEFRDNEELTEALLPASIERGSSSDEYLRAELRSAAAFTLGVLGSEEALDRLERVQIDDPNVNARFNAAAGLARNGDARAIPGLLEMLDPENDAATKDEKYDGGKEFVAVLVMTNGVRTASMLAEKNEIADLSELEAALRKLANSDAPRGVRLDAEEALHVFEKRTATIANTPDGAAANTTPGPTESSDDAEASTDAESSSGRYVFVGVAGLLVLVLGAVFWFRQRQASETYDD